MSQHTIKHTPWEMPPGETSLSREECIATCHLGRGSPFCPVFSGGQENMELNDRQKERVSVQRADLGSKSKRSLYKYACPSMVLKLDVKILFKLYQVSP